MRAFFWASNSTPSLISTFLAPDVIILFRGPWLAANFFYWFHLYCVFKKYYIYIIPSLLLLSTVVFSLAPHTGNALGVHRPPHVHFNLNNFNISHHTQTCNNDMEHLLFSSTYMQIHAWRLQQEIVVWSKRAFLSYQPPHLYHSFKNSSVSRSNKTPDRQVPFSNSISNVFHQKYQGN